jgi:predicted nucleotide-binding protein (sugar kinase/HSP70/actin superfamily)
MFSPLLKAIHTFHKNMSSEKRDALEKAVKEISDDKVNLQTNLRQVLKHLQHRNSPGTALTALYIAFELANVCIQRNKFDHDSVQIIIKEVKAHFRSHHSCFMYKTSFRLLIAAGIVSTLWAVSQFF